MSLNKLFFIILVGTGSVFGQDIGTTEVKVMEGFKPVISKASKLNENATFADTIKKDRTQIYEVVDVNLKSDYKIKPLSAAQVKDEKIPALYGTGIRVGLGTAFTTKADILYNSKRSRDFSYGVIANHFSHKYSFVKNSQNDISFYAKKITPSYLFLADLEYSRSTALHYDTEIDLVEDKFLRNRFAYTKLSFTAISKKETYQGLSHRTNFFISDLNEFSENQIHLSSNINKVINDWPISLYVRFDDYLNYNSAAALFEKEDVKYFAFHPSIYASKYGVDFDLGIDINCISSNVKMNFFPMVKMQKELVKDVILLTAGLRNIQNKYTLKSISEENPYIHSFGMNQSILGNQAFAQDLRFYDRDELYISIRNVLSKNEVLETFFTYSNIQNFAHFIRFDLPVYQRFQVDYIDVKELHLRVGYEKKINELISLELDLDYYKWDQEVYNKPKYIVSFKAPLRLRDKLKAVSSITYFSKRQSLRYSLSEDLAPISLFYYDISSQIYVDLSFHYFYSKQLSAYFELNNITNSKKDLWDGYSQIGFNGLLGVRYSF